MLNHARLPLALVHKQYGNTLPFGFDAVGVVEYAGAQFNNRMRVLKRSIA